MRKFIQRRKFLITIVISFVLVWSIPTITLVTYNSSNIRQAKQSVEEINESVLSQFSHSIDSKLGYVRSVMLQISNDAKLSKMLTRYELTPEDRYDINQIIQANSSYIISDSLISEVYLYANRSGTIITSTTVYPQKLYDVTVGSFDGRKPSEWFESACSVGNLYDDVRRVRIENNGSVREALFCVQSLPLSYGSRINGLIAIELDTRAIAAMEQETSSLFDVYMLDSDGGWLYASSKDEAMLAMAMENGGNQRISADGEEYNRIEVKENTYNISYIALAPMPIYLEKVASLENTFVIQILICVCSSVVLILLLTRNNYRSIRMIMRQASRISTNGKESNLSEMEYISNSLDLALKRQQKLQKRLTDTVQIKQETERMLHENQRAMYNNLITALVTGKNEKYDELELFMDYFGLNLSGDSYLGLRMSVYQSSPAERIDAEKLEDAFDYACTRLEQKLSMKRILCLAVQEDENTAAIMINYSESEEGSVEYLLGEICHEISATLDEDYGMRMTVGVSDLIKELEDMDIAYRQAQTAMEHGLMLGCGVLFMYRDIYSNDKMYYYPIEIEQNLLDLLQAGDLKNARMLLTRIYEENLERRSLTSQMTYYAFMDIACTLTKALGMLNTDASFTDSDSQALMVRLSSCNRTEEFKYEIEQVVENICAQVNRSKDVNQKKLKKKLIAYIDDNYTDSAMSQQTVAESLGISPSYLSKYFKQEFGENMLSYVNRKRVSLAKMLLASTDLLLDEIAERAGFGSDKTLIRVFKQYEGATPGAYRNFASERLEESLENNQTQ